MFNARGWHAAMDNHTDTPRKSIILIYEKRTPERVRPEAFASIAHRLHGAERRRLFSVEG
jgi:ectoine hydroxylase-related dioxygenase (phytanoyl-CoA dioxygenase family)